jgi:class 3 adenylate cyclase
MRCSKCGTENRAGRKFCAECGAPLNARCAACGAENEPAEKFCGECGAALAGNLQAASAKAPAPSKPTAPEIHITPMMPEGADMPEGERKTVTALFADIKGSMELIEDLDPEDAGRLVDPALKLMMDAVHRYEGYVAQSTGDGIFALFGAPIAHEDHTQRALLASLKMQEDLKRYAAKLREEGSAPIEIRVGLNTGEMVVRSVKTGEHRTEYTPIGHSTSLAARMQALAPTGSIAVSEQTQKLVEGYFEFKPLGPTRVKGVSEPVNVYELIGLGPLRTRLQLSSRRGLSRFVGRDREIEEMKRALERTIGGRGQVVAAMGEAGLGKSRLFYEFKMIAGGG